MVFKGKHPISSTITVIDKVLKQISYFQYLGCDITYQFDEDIERKINRFQTIYPTIKRI